jgi:D-alanine transaminase
LNKAYIDGEFLPLEQASVPVLDRGFLFADAIYEVIPAYAGSLFRLPQHLERLANSLGAAAIPDPHSAAHWTQLLNTLVEQNGGGDMALYLQVTRGSQPRRDHAMPQAPQPRVIAFCQTLNGTSAATLQSGISAITLADPRWQDCYIKTTALLPNVLARQRAVEQGADEALLIRDGQVTEGSASNVFAVQDGVLTTPPKSRHILPGITRDLVLELAETHALPHTEQAIFEEALPAMQELWLTSSTREIVPITRLNGAPVGDGRPGPIWRQVYNMLQRYKGAPPTTVEV